MDAKTQQRLDEIAIKTAEMNLQKAERELHQFEATEATRARQNKERQAQLSHDARQRKAVAKNCSHRQGASPKNQFKGKGPSALNIQIMPGGPWDQRISCLICRGIWVSPNPRDMEKRIRQGENAQMRNDRIAKYHADLDEFKKMLEMAGDKLSADAAEPMHTGVSIVITDTETGLQIPCRRPCDEERIAP